MDYTDFIVNKDQIGGRDGFKPVWMPDFLFDFQSYVAEWNIETGRSLDLLDCGMGKTPIGLVHAENVVRYTNRNVLVVCPLGLAPQWIREGEKFGVQLTRSRNGKAHRGLTVTNAESLHLFDPNDFSGFVYDESSGIKNMTGVRKKTVTDFARKIRYRLFLSATQSPNDYIEFGTASEALGYLGNMDMLATFFQNNEGSLHPIWMGTKWKFKPHAETGFWKYLSSFVRTARRPSDLGFADRGFTLPPLNLTEHVVQNRENLSGCLFVLPAESLAEKREERKLTLQERCEKAADLVKDRKLSLLWCNLNEEGDLLERMIPNAIQISGKDSDDWREDVVSWFIGEKCLCGHKMLRGKLAECGSQNTQKTDARSIDPMRQSEPSGSLKGELLAKTGHTCGSTTRPTSRQSAPLSNPQLETPSGEIGTHRTPNLGPNASTRQNLDRLPQDENLDSERLTELTMPISTQCSQIKAEGALSADERRSTGADTNSLLTIAIPAEGSEEYYALTAIRDSGTLRTTPNCSTEQSCTCGHASGIRRLISKPKIFGFGLNLQCCSHMVMFPSDSFEQYYQVIRRCWRFGQLNTVQVDLVITEGEIGTLKNIQRKADQAETMFENLVSVMNDSVGIKRVSAFDKEISIPSWLS